VNPPGEQRYERVGFFTRHYRPNRRVPRGFIDVAPIVDVALLVILFFMVSASYVVQPGVVLELPGSAFATGARYGDLVVTVSQEDMVFFNDERTPLDGLAQAFSQVVYENPEATLIIEADGRVEHRRIVELYNMAMAAGVKKVALATRIASGAPPQP
jgi:biopolymer transport protein ExbD